MMLEMTLQEGISLVAKLSASDFAYSSGTREVGTALGAADTISDGAAVA